MTVNAAIDPDRSVLTFCREYVEIAGDLAGIGKAFLIAALFLGIAYAVVETIKKFQDGPAPRTRAMPGTSSIKELMEALKGFVEALAKAPAWLGLFAVGLVLFWGAGASVPDDCRTAVNEPYGTTAPPTAADDNRQQTTSRKTSSGGGGNASTTADNSQ